MFQTNETRLERSKKQIIALDSEWTSFQPVMRDLCDHFSPRRARFYTSDVNKGDRRNQKILNCDPVLAVRIFRAGAMAGITSKAKTWFKYGLADIDLAEWGPVKRWLHQSSDIIRGWFARSNFYNSVNPLYGDFSVYGTAPMSFEENFDTLFHTQVFPVGSYRIAQDEFGRVNTFSREYKMTVRQLVHKFGKINENSGKIDFSNMSRFVKDAWDQSNYEFWIGVTQLIQPNDYYSPEGEKVDSKYKRFASCHWETGASNQASAPGYDVSRDTFLSEKGYKRFPILCPRWDKNFEDVYSTDSAGMTALGDNKQLQYGEKRAAEAIEKKIRPPMVAPVSLRNAMVNQLPGGVTWVDSSAGGQKFEPAFNVVQDIRELEEKQRACEGRIDKSFYVDLFRSMAIQREQPGRATATEIDRTWEESLAQAGPMLEQLDLELLDPALDLAFDYAVEQRLLPPPPKELQGQDLKVEYLSTMHMAQRALGVGTIERFAGFVGQVGAVDTTVYKKVNSMRMIEIYGDGLGINPDIMRTDEEVEAIDAEMRAAQAKQEKMMMLQQGAETAKTLADTDTEKPSALKAVAQQINDGQVAQAVNG